MKKSFSGYISWDEHTLFIIFEYECTVKSPISGHSLFFMWYCLNWSRKKLYKYIDYEVCNWIFKTCNSDCKNVVYYNTVWLCNKSKCVMNTLFGGSRRFRVTWVFFTRGIQTVFCINLNVEAIPQLGGYKWSIYPYLQSVHCLLCLLKMKR